jgi:hypothetical protein
LVSNNSLVRGATVKRPSLASERFFRLPFSKSEYSLSDQMRVSPAASTAAASAASAVRRAKREMFIGFPVACSAAIA